ncbi:MAG: CatA-like O-acetyltransferase, family 2 [Eubacteriales bacterium]|jgi:chloramphenicol O-acetyltransferase type A
MREIDPGSTKRAEAFALWMKAPMPMVTFFHTLDVTRLVRMSQKHRLKFNALLCWCIGRAAAGMEEFYRLPVGDRLMEYDALAVNVVVATKQEGISTCDVALCDDFGEFYREYLERTRQVQETGRPYSVGEEYMVIGTSALPQCELDGAVNLYAGMYNNPFLIWGKYRKSWWKAQLPISFQFHHTQMDGMPAARFLTRLQKEIDTFSLP